MKVDILMWRMDMFSILLLEILGDVQPEEVVFKIQLIHLDGLP